MMTLVVSNKIALHTNEGPSAEKQGIIRVGASREQLLRQRAALEAIRICTALTLLAHFTNPALTRDSHASHSYRTHLRRACREQLSRRADAGAQPNKHLERLRPERHRALPHASVRCFMPLHHATRRQR